MRRIAWIPRHKTTPHLFYTKVSISTVSFYLKDHFDGTVLYAIYCSFGTGETYNCICIRVCTIVILYNCNQWFLILHIFTLVAKVLSHLVSELSRTIIILMNEVRIESITFLTTICILHSVWLEFVTL